MKSRIFNSRFTWVLVIVLVVPAMLVMGQKKKPTKVKRAAPPSYAKAEVESVFFPDVFQKLVGTRPANLSEPTRVANTGGGANTPGTRTKSGDGQGWSEVISSATIENEIKAMKLAVDKSVSRPGEFKGRGYMKARTQFSILAALFAVVDQYDGEIRWKKNAKVARDLFARTAANCKSGSQQVYDQAKLRKADLGALLQGGNIEGKTVDRESWENFIDRSPLMKRLETAQQGRLQAALSSEEEFAKNADLIRHEAEMIAVLGRALLQDGMDDVGDDAYEGFARGMETAARDIVSALKTKSYDTARKAIGEISKACSNCHEDYKG